MAKRYEIRSFDYGDGRRSWHVYDNIERNHIHTATIGFLKEDKSVPSCCTKICEALNIAEDIKNKSNNSKKVKIIKCSGNWWYADMVGDVYDVTEGEGVFNLKDHPICSIIKEDCEIL